MGQGIRHGAHDAQQPTAWPADGRAAGEPLALPPRVTVRRLGERHRHELTALLDRDPGYAAFLAGNVAAFTLDGDFARFWGAFAADRLRAALMMIGRRAILYAPPGAEVEPLARVAAHEGFDFTMGRNDLVDAMFAQCPAAPVERREEHYLAELTDPRALAHLAPLQPGVAIRRATPADLDDLARLYYRSDGFEELAPIEVRRAMSGRVRAPLRTWVAEAGGQLLSAASTSAEAPGAAMIGGVWTAPVARNRGLSTAVVAALSRELLAERRRTYLFYLMDNAPAARVYARCGFRVVGRWSVVYLRHHVPT
jgi:uncharacterized protein